MTTKDFTANVISATKVVPDGNFKNSKASGVWNINEALDLIKGGNWPNAANLPPEAFVDGLFSTNVWDGGGSTATTVTNNIDLSGQGGLVWIKSRTNPGTGNFHHLVDSERGQSSGFHKALYSNGTEAENQYPSSSNGGVSSFNSNGFTVGPGSNSNHFLNASGYDYASWTFRKQPKFFDIVQYSGNGSAQTLSHNLGSTPGMMIVKRTDSAGNWRVFHRSLGATKALRLNGTDAEGTSSSYWNDTAPTSTQFTIGTDLSDSGTNNFIAYLFAHNNDDGNFGEPGDQDIIKCGSYTGDGTTDGSNEITLGFEPQWIFLKRSDGSGYYSQIIDNMRGMVSGGNDQILWPNVNAAENGTLNSVDATATGFSVNDSSNSNLNSSTWIYMAIRRGGMQTPTAASSVFAIDTQSQTSAPYAISNFPVDMALRKDTDGSSTDVHARLTQGKGMFANSVNAEGSDNIAQFDYQNGYLDNTSQDSTKYAWMWKRARGYFDVTTWTGTGSARTVSHNLGAVPEMMWVKKRSSGDDWFVYVGSLGNTNKLELNSTSASGSAAVGGNQLWNSTTPTSSVFSVSDNVRVNESGETYIAYLFATVAGVSKVGSYTGNGSSSGPTVDCGFSGSPRFVLIKKATGGTGSWYVFDSVRGIVAGAESQLYLNSTAAEQTATDQIDPTSSGFQIVINSGGLNTDGETYIFYAIA